MEKAWLYNNHTTNIYINYIHQMKSYKRIGFPTHSSLEKNSTPHKPHFSQR